MTRVHGTPTDRCINVRGRASRTLVRVPRDACRVGSSNVLRIILGYSHARNHTAHSLRWESHV